jgi:8-amino-7-oxononanoate synthase
MSGEGRDLARAWAEEELQRLSVLGLRRQLEPLLSPQGAVVRIGGESLLNFSSNDYLGLANDPRVSRAATAGMDRHGLGTGASRLVVGDSSAHQFLELKLAGFMGASSALLFNSGYAANVGILSALMGEGDVIFSDALNHASLIDGCRLSRAARVIYPHGDLEELDRLLGSTPARRRLVCTDAVFSMDGDLAPLEGLVELCRRHGAALMVDEAHAVGVLGTKGAGLCDALGLGDSVDVRVGTLGKSLGAFGAFAVCAPEVRELLFNRARSLVFSTSLPASLCAAATCAVEIVEREPELREALWRNIRRFSDGLRALGFPAEPRSPIFPLVLGDPRRAVEASHALRARGLLVKAIRPPTVPKGTSRLRFALSAAHREEHIDKALEAVSALRAGT